MRIKMLKTYAGDGVFTQGKVYGPEAIEEKRMQEFVKNGDAMEFVENQARTPNQGTQKAAFEKARADKLLADAKKVADAKAKKNKPKGAK
jgi:hypothetical protein